MARTGDRWFEPELHRLKGELSILAGGDLTEAASCFQRAGEIAGATSARLMELRAATSLARLWRDAGQPMDARQLLGPICSWFTEGLGGADMRDACALLGDLGQSEKSPKEV